jgi:hypothetical protein
LEFDWGGFSYYFRRLCSAGVPSVEKNADVDETAVAGDDVVDLGIALLPNPSPF